VPMVDAKIKSLSSHARPSRLRSGSYEGNGRIDGG
jgi:hypothetical protein